MSKPCAKLVNGLGLLMSNITLYKNAESLVLKQETDFAELAKIHNAVNFKREASFALQILQSNAYTLGIAAKNPDSLKNAILNVAAIGLSLSPVHKYAYLIGRKDAICLDPSYIGLVKLATDSGSIKWAAAELVREKDDFVFNGHGHEPTHKFNPFQKDRGEITGGYCLAKTHNGEFIVVLMPIDDIHKIRAKSESFKKNSGPWITDYEEMCKKTLIRRAYKSWPKTDTRDDRFAKAIKMLDDVDVIDTDPVAVERTVPEDSELTKTLEQIRGLLTTINRTEEKYVAHLTTVHRRKIEKLDDLTDVEVAQALVELTEIASKKAPKKPEVENA